MEESMPTPADTPVFFEPPPLRPVGRPTGRDWMIRIGFCVLATAGFWVMLGLDVPLMQWRYRHIPAEVQGQGKQFVVSLRDFGQALPIAVVLIIIFRMDRRRGTVIAALLLAQLFAAIGYNTGKYMVARYRPFAAKDVQAGGDATQLKPYESWLGYKRTLRQTDGRKAYLEGRHPIIPLGPLRRRLRLCGRPRVVLPAASPALVAPRGRLRSFSRFIDAVHWPSDCWAGATLGIISAWLALRAVPWKPPTCETRSNRAMG